MCDDHVLRHLEQNWSPNGKNINARGILDLRTLVRGLRGVCDSHLLSKQPPTPQHTLKRSHRIQRCRDASSVKKRKRRWRRWRKEEEGRMRPGMNGQVASDGSHYNKPTLFVFVRTFGFHLPLWNCSSVSCFLTLTPRQKDTHWSSQRLSEPRSLSVQGHHSRGPRRSLLYNHARPPSPGETERKCDDVCCCHVT